MCPRVPRSGTDAGSTRHCAIGMGVAGDPGYAPPTPPDMRVRIRRFSECERRFAPLTR
jgi:hypothetical protein